MKIAKWILRCYIKCTLRCTPQVHSQVDNQFGVICIYFFTFFCIFVQHRVPPQVHFFIESFCALLYPNKCTTIRIFKGNSIVTLRVALISTSNAPFCASLYRSQSTPLGVRSDKPSMASSVALTNAPQGASSSATSNASVLSPSYSSSMVL